ncbi:MAG: GrpB family protein [Nocardioides sp.]
MSEERPEVEYVQPRILHNAPIHLADPDPSWPEQYAVQAAAIRAAIGDRALLLEHVGSTSVPGLPAKPILDVLLLVADPADEASYVPDLEAAGFLLRLREPGWHEHRLLRGSDPSVNLHVFGAGSTEADRMLMFRDRLRSHPEERDHYARTKSELAARTWAVVQDYADAKSEVVESIIARARAGSGR